MHADRRYNTLTLPCERVMYDLLVNCLSFSFNSRFSSSSLATRRSSIRNFSFFFALEIREAKVFLSRFCFSLATRACSASPSDLANSVLTGLEASLELVVEDAGDSTCLESKVSKLQFSTRSRLITVRPAFSCRLVSFSSRSYSNSRPKLTTYRVYSIVFRNQQRSEGYTFQVAPSIFKSVEISA